MIHFDLPKEKSSIIKVIGVGGGGSNAVNHMFSQNIDGVNFMICNTDAQAIAQSKVPNKIQLGPHLTQGLGAGANPQIGRQATEESLEEIKKILEVNTKMAFVTAGMGGGTGTGGAPIVAQICKDLGVLTVGIVTTPFAYEGRKRMQQAEAGIAQLKEHVDTLLVISNDKLRHQFGNLKMREAFAKADNVLATAAKCITDVISSTGQINVDFADVCTVMKNGGVAILGNAQANGEGRAQKAIQEALASPLLNDNDISGARWILLNINSAEGEHEFTMDEAEVIQDFLVKQAGKGTDIILGMGYDNTLGDNIGITIIATGFEHKDPFAKELEPAEEVENKEPEKVVMTLEMPLKENKAEVAIQPTLQFEDEEKDIAEITEAPVMVVEDALMPKLIEHTESDNEKVYLPSKTTGDKKDETPVFYEISSLQDQIPAIQFDLPQNPIPEKATATTYANTSNSGEIISSLNIVAKEASNPSSSGGFLVKPVQIYVQEEQEESKPIEEPLPVVLNIQEDEPELEMQLVVKESTEAAEEPLIDQQTQPIMMPNVEEPAPQDEAEGQRRRAMERIAKLRNLSFNINAADPNNEFETVPAYLRRQMEMHNQIASVETFYSNYTVKTDENNNTEISTINNFMDAKKPC